MREKEGEQRQSYSPACQIKSTSLKNDEVLFCLASRAEKSPLLAQKRA
jgi:hypothetical protein